MFATKMHVILPCGEKKRMHVRSHAPQILKSKTFRRPGSTVYLVCQLKNTAFTFLKNNSKQLFIVTTNFKIFLWLTFCSCYLAPTLST